MYVVIDSNIIIANYNLRNSDFQIFCKHFPEMNMDVYVSKVTFEEVIKNHKKYILKVEREFNSSVRELNNGSTKNIDPLLKDYSLSEHERYKTYLESTLRTNNIRLLDYPKITHEEIVKYSVTGKKPFNEKVVEETGKKRKVIETKDSGYKDFLIWSSIVELLTKSKRPVVLITKDTDFMKEKKLHFDLQEHLKSNSIDPTRVQIETSFHEFNEKHLASIYKIVEIKSLFKTTELRKKLEENASDYFEIYIQKYNIKEISGFPSEYEQVSISGINSFNNFEIHGVDVINENHIIISFSVDVNCQVEFYIYKSDLYILPEEYEPTIINDNWNDHYVLAEDDYNFSVICNFSSDREANISDFSIVSIEKN